MRVVALGGAGGMGRRAVELLTREPGVEIVVADRDVAGAERVAERSGAEVASVDVRDHDELVALFRGASLVMNTVGPFVDLAEPVLRAVLDARVDYCDICDDWGPTRDVFETFSDPVREAGLRWLIGMGASPGISNLLARYAYERLDDVDEVHTAWTAGGGGGGESSEPSAALVHMLLGAAGRIPVWEQGGWHDVPAFRDPVEVRFPLTGSYTCYAIGHPEPITLPRFLPGLDRCVNYGALQPSGLNDLVRRQADLIESGDVTASDAAREFMVLASEEPERWLRHDGGEGGLCAFAVGVLDGTRVRLSVTAGGFPHGGMGPITGYPLAIAAAMMLRGDVSATGVLAPEAALQPRSFLEAFAPTWKLRLGDDVVVEEVEELV